MPRAGFQPAYILEYLLNSAGLTPGEDVEIIYRSEHAELATLMASGDVVLRCCLSLTYPVV